LHSEICEDIRGKSIDLDFSFEILRLTFVVSFAVELLSLRESRESSLTTHENVTKKVIQFTQASPEAIFKPAIAKPARHGENLSTGLNTFRARSEEAGG
jgi:hypothetical protein